MASTVSGLVCFRSIPRRSFACRAMLAAMIVGVVGQTAMRADVGPNFVSETLIAGLTEPTAIKFLPDGRMLMLSRYGTLQQVQPGASVVDPSPFMTLSNVDTDQGERGLTGI